MSDDAQEPVEDAPADDSPVESGEVADAEETPEEGGAEEEKVVVEEEVDEEVEVEEEEPVDPKPEIEESCKPRCVKQWLSYEACAKRVEVDDGQKHCTGQYFDYWGCIDKCVATEAF